MVDKQSTIKYIHLYTKTVSLSILKTFSFFNFLLIVMMLQHLRGRSRTAATLKTEHFLIIVKGWKPLTIITKSSILDIAAVLDPSVNLDPFYATGLFLYP